jgi:hypothetical protein
MTSQTLSLTLVFMLALFVNACCDNICNLPSGATVEITYPDGGRELVIVNGKPGSRGCAPVDCDRAGDDMPPIRVVVGPQV